MGYNLKEKHLTVTAPAEGEVKLPLDSDQYRSRVNMKVEVSRIAPVGGTRTHEDLARAQKVTVPVSINARLQAGTEGAADADLYRFEAEQGQQIIFETRAALLGSLG